MEKTTRRRGSKLLSDRELRATKPGDSPLYDGDGIRFLPSKTTRGQSSGQLRFTRPDGKPDTFSLGVYPTVTLAAARDKAQAARELVAAGTNPNTVKQQAKAKASASAANTFGAVAARWAEREARLQQWTPAYVDEVAQCMRNHLAELDDVPVSEIFADVVAPILHRVEVAAPGMAQRAKRRLNAVMDFACECGLIRANPLPRPRQRKQSGKGAKGYAAVTDLPGVGAILRAAMATPARAASVNRAHLLLVFTAQRIAEILGARWNEFDLDAGLWTLPRDRMKIKDADRGAHVIPLPPGLLASLRQWRAEDGERATYVCAAKNGRKPIIPERVGVYYRETLELNGAHSPHSWRSAFSTVCREAGKPGEVVEAQLDHIATGSKVASRYDRAKRIELRRELLAWYEATLLAARDGANVVPMRRKK